MNFADRDASFALPAATAGNAWLVRYDGVDPPMAVPVATAPSLQLRPLEALILEAVRWRRTSERGRGYRPNLRQAGVGTLATKAVRPNPAGRLVDGHDHDGVAVLVAHEQETAVRADDEVARRTTFRGPVEDPAGPKPRRP